MHRAMEKLHPAVTLICVLSALLGSLILFHPLAIGLSCLCALLCTLFLNGWRQTKKTLCLALPVSILAALFNPLFSHSGLTVRFYLFGNPITVESVLYGLCMGGMLLCAMLWFGAYRDLMGPDQIMELLGRPFPKFSLMLSMTLRLIPLTLSRAGDLIHQQKALGKEPGRHRIREAVELSAALLSRNMEESMETSDAMRARGYESPVRKTHFRSFSWKKKDTVALCVLLILDAVVIILWSQTDKFVFYPRLSSVKVPLPAVIFYAAMLLFPLLYETEEVLRWKNWRR